MVAVVLAVVLCSLFLTAEQVPQSNAQKLHNQLFKNYSKSIRPVQDESTTVQIQMQLWLMQILKVDEIDQMLTVYCWVEEYWTDEFLKWNPEQFGGITTLRIPASQIWRPDILVYNNADMNVRENEVSTNVVVNYTGSLVCFRAVIFKLACSLDMTYFPFDIQNCSMLFASWSHDSTKLFIKLPPNGANETFTQYYIENTEWKLLSIYATQNFQRYSCCPEDFVELVYRFTLQRNPSYYTVNLIIPSLLITVVTMVGFFTPYSTTGENTEKVSLGVTAMLSLAIILLMVADRMPATSNVIPLIGKYYMGLIFWIFIATIVTTATLRLQSKGRSGKPLSSCCRNLFFNVIAKLLLMKIDIKPKRSKSQKYLSVGSHGSSSSQREKLLQGSLRLDNLNRKSSDNGSPNVWIRRKDPAMGSQTSFDDALKCLSMFESTIQLLHQRLEDDYFNLTIIHEWEQLARICDRLLMYIFIVGCALFALFMLQGPALSAVSVNPLK